MKRNLKNKKCKQKKKGEREKSIKKPSFHSLIHGQYPIWFEKKAATKQKVDQTFKTMHL